MKRGLRFLVTAVALGAATAGCAVHETTAPDAIGPSTTGHSLQITITPDRINQDGASQSAVSVLAIGPNGQAESGRSIRMDILFGGQLQDFGTLSARTIVTGPDGIARTVFTAPPSAGPLSQTVNVVSIRATPLGTNSEVFLPVTGTVSLMPVGVILPPAGTPSPCFTTSPSVVAANLPIVFTAGSLVSGSCQAPTSDILVFSWTFGDGTTASGRTVTHTFSSTNTFQVSLTETNDRNVSGTTTVPIAVGSASLPTPLFTFSPSAPGVNETVFFNASTSLAGAGHTIVSYRWTFGDGATGSGVTTSHAYATAGTYTVQLTVTDESGQSATSTGTPITPGNPPGPRADFTFSPNPPVTNQNVVFDWRTTTTTQGTSIVALEWNFGDSTPIVRCPGDSACTSDGITSHTFTTAGIYNVNLLVRDSAGRISTASKPVNVGTGAPIANLSVSKTNNPTPLSIQADGSASTAAPGAVIVTYRFSWGDGTADTSGNAASAPHTYTLPGTYLVRLTVTDNAVPARSGTTTASITVP